MTPRLRARIAVLPALGLAIAAMQLLASAAESDPPDRVSVVLGGLFAVFGAISAYGLVAERFWGRWPGLGLSIAGIFLLIAATSSGRVLEVFEEWQSWALLLGALVELGCLLGPGVERRYEGASRLWREPGPELRWIRRAIIWSIAGMPNFLLLGAIAAEEHLAGSGPAVVGAGLTSALGCLLAARQKVAGLFMLTLGALAWLGIGVWFTQTIRLDGDQVLVFGSLSLASWLPALIAAAISCVVFARPMWRFLRVSS
jgi:hypothetical protein